MLILMISGSLSLGLHGNKNIWWGVISSKTLLHVFEPTTERFELLSAVAEKVIKKRLKRDDDI